MENQGRREQQEKESKLIMVYCLLGTALVLIAVTTVADKILSIPLSPNRERHLLNDEGHIGFDQCR